MKLYLFYALQQVLLNPATSGEAEEFYNVTRRVMSMMTPKKFISYGKASYVLDEDPLYRLFGECLVCNAVVH